MGPASSSSLLNDIRLLKLAEMYEQAFERFVRDLALLYVKDDEVRRRLETLLDPSEDHEGRITRELTRLNALIPAEREAAVERAALLDICDVERAAREFYVGNIQEVRDPAVARLFRELAHEEQRHAEAAEAALRLSDLRRGWVPSRDLPTSRVLDPLPLWEGAGDIETAIRRLTDRVE